MGVRVLGQAELLEGLASLGLEQSWLEVLEKMVVGGGEGRWGRGRWRSG